MSTQWAPQPSGSFHHGASSPGQGRPGRSPAPTDTSGFRPGPGYAVSGQGGPAGAPARRRSGRPIVIGVLVVGLALCVGGGAAAYFFFATEESPTGADRPAAATSPAVAGSGSATPAPSSAAPSASKQPGGGEEEVSGDLAGFKQGDCLTVDEAADNRVEKARCTDPGAQKVLLRKNGTLDDSACASVAATFSLSQDAAGSTKDFVLCVGPVA